MIRAKGRYRNGALEFEQPLQLSDGSEVEVMICSAQEIDTEAWINLGMERLEAEWNNPEDAIYDDWKKLYGV